MLFCCRSKDLLGTLNEELLDFIILNIKSYFRIF